MKDQSSDKEKTPDQPGYRYAQIQKEPTPQDAIDYLEKGPVAPEPSFKETQAEMLREILSNWKDNQAAKRVGDSYESEDFFIAAELEKFTITRKKENN